MKADRIFLLHIRDALRDITAYAEPGEEAFHKDRKTQDAIIRKLEVIGEATKRLSPELKRSRPDIPWRQISGMRDKLIHDYFGVDITLVWSVVVNIVPQFSLCIEQLILESEADPPFAPC